MSPFLLAAILTGTPVETTTDSVDIAARAMLPECTTGTLLFSEGDCLVIRAATRSKFTHVGVVVEEKEGRAVVYDAQNGVGVRRLPLRKYLAAQQPDRVHVLQPKRRLGEKAERELQQSLEQHLGRPYSARQYFTGEQTEGVHCSQYATEVLMTCGVVEAKKPWHVSPGSLRRGVLREDLYDHVATVSLERPVEPEPEPSSWCGRMWRDTVDCTRGFCFRVRRSFACE